MGAVFSPPSPPKPAPAPPPPPAPAVEDPAVAQRKKDERAAAIKRQGRQQTILTSPLGDTSGGTAPTKSAKLGGTA